MKYRKLTLGILLLMALTASGTLYAAEYVFAVKEDHWRGGQGKLILTEEGVEFRAEKSKDARRWLYRDIKTLDIVSSHRLVIQTYENAKWKLGTDRVFSFQIVEGELTEAVYRFLLGRFDKPITMRLPLPAADSVHTLPVKHRHRRGGCQGLLRIGKDQVIYETDKTEDRRVWFYKDIESVGSSGPLDLRITAATGTYTFELKERMSDPVYEYLWERVNRVRLEPFRQNQ